MMLLLRGMIAVWPAAAMSPAVTAVAVAPAVVVASLRHLTAGPATMRIGVTGPTTVAPELDAIVCVGRWRRGWR